MVSGESVSDDNAFHKFCSAKEYTLKTLLEKIMSKENIPQFYEALVKDEKRKKILLELSKEGEPLNKDKRVELVKNHILPMAKEMGFEFTFEELDRYEAELFEQKNKGDELSDDELEVVAGGGVHFHLALCFISGTEDFSGDADPKDAVNNAVCYVAGIGF